MTIQRCEIVLRREGHLLTIDALAASARLHPALVEKLVEAGLLDPVQRQGERLLFDPSAVGRLRTIERLRRDTGANLPGIAIILDLVERLAALRRENEYLRVK
jgi:DNA-binding transcriptional MerR regulator